MGALPAGDVGHSEGRIRYPEGPASKVIKLGLVEVQETKLAEICRRYHVRELSMFGSAARGDMRPGSDVNFLVEYQPEAKVDLMDHAGLMLNLSELMGHKVDSVTRYAGLSCDARLPAACAVGYLCVARFASSGSGYAAPGPSGFTRGQFSWLATCTPL